MPALSSATVSRLHASPSQTRNICIVAHVDHGKTTLADSLVASNGIISSRMAGKLRYLDSRPDEQLRGITMKSSCISLLYSMPASSTPLINNLEDQQPSLDYLVNLIDTPGHVDFSSEVSTAVRLCDGAVVVVDVVEGVCPQTYVVLKQAWEATLRPVLVLNKIDRLVVETKMTPTEAFARIKKILIDVNAAVGELYATEALRRKGEEEEDDEETTTSSPRVRRDTYGSNTTSFQWTSAFDEADDDDVYFSPESGNVVFASAVDGWGFSLERFVEVGAEKLGVPKEDLRKSLWGDYYLNAKDRSLRQGAAVKGKKPLFVQLVLENLWSIYDAVLEKRDKAIVEKIVASLRLKILPRDSRNSDARVWLRAILSQWLPLADAVLEMVCRKLPSPVELEDEKIQRLMAGNPRTFEKMPADLKELLVHFKNCSPLAPTIVLVSKVFSVESRQLPVNRRAPMSEEELQARKDSARKAHSERLRRMQLKAEIENEDSSLVDDEDLTNEDDDASGLSFVALARVYSGILHKGQSVYVLCPDRVFRETSVMKGERDLPAMVKIQDLFLLMGRDLESLDSAPAGTVVGVAGLSDRVHRSATLSSLPFCPSLAHLQSHCSKPIVRVAIEPKNPKDVDAVLAGMKALSLADPCVEVLTQATGEHVLVAAGEVHLERCLKDLTEMFARVPLDVSSPIVGFRETIIKPPRVDRVNETIVTPSSESSDEDDAAPDESSIVGKSVVVSTPDLRASLRVQTIPLPRRILDVLEANESSLKLLSKLDSAESSSVSEEEKSTIRRLKEELTSAAEAVDEEEEEEEDETKGDGESLHTWRARVDKIVAFGPKRLGFNALIFDDPNYERPSIWPSWIFDNVRARSRKTRFRFRDNDSAILGGFYLATGSGPLCREPLHGVCVVVEKWRESDVIIGDSALSPHGPHSGQLMSATSAAIYRALKLHPLRLMTAMYSCEIHATADVLGRMYAVLGKRQGRVERERLREGSNVFVIDAVLPVVESFGFCDEVRKRTSGLASPQLVFSHWETFDLDPLWVPTTEEEYAHFGEKADSENVARKYMNDVRRRKGIKVDEKIVEFGEKQRTLKKNK